jgi:Lrp/AsnC family transcriptional regulator of lysine biosynthesis
MNSRASYTEIARIVGLSETAVRKRLGKLVSRGIIKRFTIEYALEGEIQALVLVKTQMPPKTPEISSRIRVIDGVEFIYEVTGEYDIVVLVRGSSINEINSYIDKIRSIPGVASTYTMIVLRKIYD